jgi:hypothetical protein
MPSKPSKEKIITATKVLEKISAYDPYFARPADSVLLAWASALTLVNIAEDVALEAVDHMYANVSSADFRPLPGLLIQHCREVRRERFELERKSQEEVEAEEEAEKITMREWEERHGEKFPRGKLGKVIPFPDDPDMETANLRRVACPHCRAPIGSPCVVAGSNTPLTNLPVHWSRRAAAQKLVSR